MTTYDNTIETLVDEYLSNRKGPWILAWSGGKDSSFLLHAVLDALKLIPPSHLTRQVKILSNDTQVESPFVQNYVKSQSECIIKFIEKSEFPIEFMTSYPNPANTFWVNVIGRGYPAPTRHFRWCTDRLKIRPTIEYIKQITESFGSSTLLLGVRRSESSQRSKIAKKYDKDGRLNPHHSLKKCMVFRPILEWDTDSVWEFLAENKPPWAGNYDDLIRLYRDAIGGECPIVLDPDAAPSCGSSSIRFGCWTCTVVQKDKSFRGSIENTNLLFEPMADFRDWLKDVSQDKTRRMGIRRNGQEGLGPMNIALREEILRNVLKVQKTVGEPLISDEEIHEIKRIWRVDKAMFDGYFRFREAKNEMEKSDEHREKVTC